MTNAPTTPSPIPDRPSLDGLEDKWGQHGFVRIHRSFLVALPLVAGLSLARAAA